MSHLLGSSANYLENLINRLNVILEERFHCRVVYFSDSELKERDLPLWGKWQQAFLSADVEQTLYEGDVVLPVRSLNQTLEGFVIVFSSAALSPAQLGEALKLIQGILLDSIVQSEKLEKLIEIEKAFTLANCNYNILPLRPRTRPSGDFKDFWSLSSGPRFHSTKPILLHGENVQTLLQAALEIHDLLRNVAMVRLTDLPEEVVESDEDWQNLGFLTILIPKAEQLPLHMIERLQALSARHSLSYPQLIACLETDNPDSYPHLQSLFKSRFRCPGSSLSSERLGHLLEIFLKSEAVTTEATES